MILFTVKSPSVSPRTDPQAAMQPWTFGLPMLGSAALNNVFVTYYLDFFMEHERVSSSAFYQAQLVFMVWNAVNDLALGWLSDVWGASRDGRRNRTQAIRVGGPLWALSFMVTWVPWGEAGSTLAAWHFLVSLCLYDGMLTYVEVNHQALMVDLSTDDDERAELNKYSALAAAVGSCSAFFARLFWDAEDLRAFQLTCLVIALLSAVSFEVAAVRMRPLEVARAASVPGLQNTQGKGESPSFKLFSKHLSTQRNFVLFVVFSAVQVFDCTFEKTFFARFLARSAGGALSVHAQGTIVSLSFILPHFVTVLTTRLVHREGLYKAIQRILELRLGLIALSWLVGDAALAGSFFLLSNRVTSECVCRVSPLVLSELADEDMMLRRRRQNMSATIFGYAALFTKPSQSFAPLVGLALPDAWAGGAPLLLPGVCVLVQRLLWKHYSLRGAQLAAVKEYVQLPAPAESGDSV